jgi:hypothetical protein
MRTERRKKAMSNQEKMSVIEFDVEEKDMPAMVALGARLAILQGIYDVTYMEIVEVVSEKFKDRKVIEE